MSLTPILEGHGLRLEPICEAHLPGLQEIATDPTIWHYMTVRLLTADDVRGWVEESTRQDQTPSAQVWVTRLDGGGVIGATRLFDLNWQHRTGEIGYTWLAAPYRGSGANPRVKLLQLTHAFETLGLRRVALKTHHENLRSQRGILKLGAVYEGTFRNHMIMPDGTTRHTAWYSIVAEEWPGVKASLLQRIAAEPLRQPSRTER